MKQVKGYLQRKTMLYKTGVEYGDYTMNHVQGCAHEIGRAHVSTPVTSRSRMPSSA